MRPEFGEPGWGEQLLQEWEDENYHTESGFLGPLIEVLPEVLDAIKNEQPELARRLYQAVQRMESL